MEAARRPILIPQLIRDRIDEIRNDNTSGSVTLSIRTALTIQMAARHGMLEMNDAGEIKDHISEVVKELARAQPAMAPMINLGNLIFREMDDGGIDNVETICDEYMKKINSSLHKVADFGSDMIENGARVMTYSNSSTILETFLKATEKGKNYHVILSEARPILEGVALAEKLTERGIDVELVADCGLFQRMDDVDLVLIGADSISSSGLVNKAGTKGLVITGRELGKPVYSLCGTEKFIPSEYRMPFDETKDPAELYDGSTNLNVNNFYFDRTPLKYLSGVITQEGLTDIVEVSERCKKLKMHPDLL